MTSLDTQVMAPNMETYTTDDALSMMGFGKFQALVLFYAGMGWVAEAMELMLLSFLGPFIREEWNVSPENESLLSSAVRCLCLGLCFRQIWTEVRVSWYKRKRSHNLVVN
jgi:hypothetical protein